MTQSERERRRPPKTPPRTELIELRKQKYPGLLAKEFAKLLGCSRMHMTSVEVGRRPPGLELALRWLELLAPEARIDMFGPLPMVEARIDTMRRLQRLSPETYQAA